MQRFQNPEIALEIPDDWVDVSSTAFTFPEAASTLALDRAPITPSATLADCETDVLRQLSAVFPGLELVGRRLMQNGGADVVQLTLEWSCETTAVRQVVALTIADGALWSLAASTPTACLEETEGTIERALRSFTHAGSELC